MTADSTQMQRPVMNPHEKRMQTIQAVLYVIAIILGLINGFYGSEFWIQTGEFISTIFIRLFRFIAVPIIAVSIIATLSQISRSTESGRIFRHSVFYTLLTTILAASLAAILFEVFSPANVTLSDTTEASAAIAGIIPVNARPNAVPNAADINISNTLFFNIFDLLIRPHYEHFLFLYCQNQEHHRFLLNAP